MRILFISSLDFQTNGAAQSRQRQYMEGLQSLGFQVALINPTRRPAGEMTFPVYCLPRWSRFVPRRLAAVLLVTNALALRAKPDHLIMCFGLSQVTLLPALIVSRLRGLAFLHELTEHPDEMMPAGPLGRLSLAFFERLSLPGFAGVVVISRALKSYVLARTTGSKIILVPAIAKDTGLLGTIPMSRDDRSTQRFSFLYAGSLSEPKDGVISLITAFTTAFKENGLARLDLLGYGSAAQKAAVQAAIVDHGVSQSVALHDPVPQADLPARLAAADALVLCRPLSRQATYGFPTKLAEYLATGRPVVVTLTSDIGHYLRDGVSGFLVPPNDVDAFASALHRAASDPVKAAQIGAAGHAVFLAEFEAGRAVGKLAEWLRSRYSQPGGPV